MREEIEKIGSTIKDRWRELKSGGCKIISSGSDCDCTLCLVDKLLSHIRKVVTKDNLRQYL